jgi:hypothetical protein
MLGCGDAWEELGGFGWQGAAGFAKYGQAEEQADVGVQTTSSTGSW